LNIILSFTNKWVNYINRNKAVIVYKRVKSRITPV
jgi:hypothetical protein